MGIPKTIALMLIIIWKSTYINGSLFAHFWRRLKYFIKENLEEKFVFVQKNNRVPFFFLYTYTKVLTPGMRYRITSEMKLKDVFLIFDNYNWQNRAELVISSCVISSCLIWLLHSIYGLHQLQYLQIMCNDADSRIWMFGKRMVFIVLSSVDYMRGSMAIHVF